MTFAIFWFLFALAAGIYAHNRGRSGVGWFVLSLIISPLLGLLFVAVARDLSKAAAGPATPSQATHLKCPACAEWVLPEATKCKHCGESLTPQPDYAQARGRALRQAENQNLLIGLGVVMFFVGVIALLANLS